MERYHPSEVYELFVRHMNTPRVAVDNGVCETATLVQVHSARKHGVLLEAVAALSDHGVCVRKGYISSDDGRWFMDVFHVTDADGRKISDTDRLLARVESALSASADALPWPAAAAPPPSAGEGRATLLELVGVDRPGLLSEVFAVLHDLRCDTVDARAWTHGGRVAALVFVRDEDTAAPIDDAARVRRIESRLRHVLRGGARGARTVQSDAAAAAGGGLDRRLHQLLNEDGEAQTRAAAEAPSTTAVAVQEWGERGYSVLTVSCRDRPKLLFDVVCTLTDLDYVVYHGTFDTDGDHAHQICPSRTVREEFFSAFQEEMGVKDRLEQVQAALERATEDVDLMGRLLDELDLLQRRSQDVDLDMVEVKIQKVMPELGFAPEDADRLVASFSGGWKVRMSLGNILPQDPNLLLLDEPTNHVDLDTIESYLKTQDVPMVIISDDRAFLEVMKDYGLF